MKIGPIVRKASSAAASKHNLLRYVAACVAGGLLALPFTAALAEPRDVVDASWYHPLNFISYWAPGGPNAGPNTHCFVATELKKEAPGDFASITTNFLAGNHPESECGAAWVEVCVAPPGQNINCYHHTATLPGDPKNRQWSAFALSRGDTGAPIFGARFGALGTWAHEYKWNVVVSGI